MMYEMDAQRLVGYCIIFVLWHVSVTQRCCPKVACEDERSEKTLNLNFAADRFGVEFDGFSVEVWTALFPGTDVDKRYPRSES